MDARIQRVELEAPALNLGDGRFSRYDAIVPGYSSAEVISLDLEGARRPHVMADLEWGIPFRSCVFQTCVAFNVLEHLFDFEKVVASVHRVLRPGGRFICAVPFLVRVHADPNDYFRYTGAALERMSAAAGFSDIEIEPLGAGALTAALSQMDFLIPRWLRSPLFNCASVLDARVSRRSGYRFRNERDYPLAYLLSARKDVGSG